MKRILSAVLAITLGITAIGSVIKGDLLANASESQKETIFQSGDYTEHINPDIETDKGDKGIWLGDNDNTWVSSNVNNQDAPYMGSNDSSGKLLARNKIANNNLTNFEWQFDFRSDATDKANASFAFHVNENSDVSSYSARKNIFAITLYGSSYTSDKANYYVPNSLNVEYPNTSGAMRPFSYDTSVTPFVTNPSSYVKLDDSSAQKAIDLSKYVTINIKLIDRTIIVSAWQTADKENTFRMQTVTFGTGSVFNNAFTTAAPSGDFAVISGADSGNYKVANMKISSLNEMFDSNDYLESKHINSMITTSSTDGGIWLGDKSPNAYQNTNVWVSSNVNNQDAPYMGKTSISGKLLARNKKLTTSADDFEWQFEFKPDKATTANASFAFHVNSNSDVSSYNNRKNMYAVTLYGSDYSDKANTLQIEYPTESGMAVAGSLNIGNMMLSGTATTYITVNIRMMGQTIIVSAWQTANKASTYKTAIVGNVGGEALAPSGDFMVFAGDSTDNYKLKNMQMYSFTSNVFNSANYKSNKHVNPDAYIPVDSGYWLANNDNTWVSMDKTTLYMKGGQTSAKLLQRNKVSTASVENFEWQFNYKSDNAAKACTAFAFHVNSSSDVGKFETVDGAYVLSLYGSDYQMPNSLVLEIPTANGLVETATLKLDDTEKSAIDLSKYITVDIQMYGKKLCVSVWQTDDRNGTWRTLTVDDIGGTDIAPSGDFVVLAGEGSSQYRLNTMEISVLKDGIISTKPDGIYYSNDFEENTNGIKMLTTPKEAELTGVMEESNGNHYYQMSFADSSTNKRGGWTTFEITPDKQYKDFTLNFKVKLDPDINPNYNVNDQFMLIAFHSKNGINKSNILEIGAKGADFSVADNTNNKTYTNNRIAFAGGKSGTYGKGFDLPDEYYPAGISADDAWYRVSLVVKGWTYKYYLNGELMMEVTDPEKLYDEGKIHITCCRLNVQIDDVEITTNDIEIGHFEYTQESTGLLYENTFENEGDDTRLTVVAGTDYGLVKDQNGNTYYHINYKRSATNEANGSMRILFGPTGVKNFTLNMKVRITKEVSDKWHSVIPMGRINSGFYLQSRIFTKGSYMLLQDENVTTTAEAEQGKLRMPEIARTGPAAANTTSTNPCHDKAYGMSILEWHKISFVAEDFKYTLYIDGIKILEGTDIYQLTEYGSFGLRSEGVDLDVDDIKIWGTPHYDLSFTEEVPTGDLYVNDFEADNSLDSIKFIYYDDDETKVMSEENGNKFLRTYPNTDVNADGKLVVTGAGNMMFTIGPPNTMDFELTYRLRVKSNTNENSGFAFVGIHSDPSNAKWNSVWINMLARGTSVSLKDNSRKLGIDNLIAKTGKNRSGDTQYQPSDNRAFGIRPDGKWHDIKVICKGYTYTLYVDGKEYISATDTDKTFYKGYTVLGSNGCILDIDDIKMTNN